MIDTTYKLDGGGEVRVCKPFGDDKYIAYVTMDGCYPERGKIARNYKRDEFLTVIEGGFDIEIDGHLTKVAVGESILIPDAACYTISGSGHSVILINDQKGGETLIENQIIR